ncbi:MAG: GspE/PulE family protein [Rhodanobacteraceae bacterium]
MIAPPLITRSLVAPPSNSTRPPLARSTADTLEAAKALALKFGLPMAELDVKIPQSLLDEVPAVIARDHRALPLGYRNEQLRIAMSEPFDGDTLQLLQFLTGRSLLIEIAPEDALLRKIDASYEFLDENRDFATLEATADRTDKKSNKLELEAISAAKPVVRLVNNVIMEAIRRNASDIHVRPGENDVELIFRIDGDLILIRRFPRALLRGIVGRIKILSVMDITEHRLPQDGQIHFRDREHAIDIRVSIMPSIEGESVVMRLLLATMGTKNIAEIGLSPVDTQHFKDALDRSNGMILVTGPTGSGKTTTLYAALKEVIRKNVNIITVENPVEFHIPGITQIPINSDIGMTFAAALRNILRHDPDVIMVGEIRDQETAKIAVESAQTGHLVLSTLHTNSAVSTIARLIEMGVESYLLRATLLAVLAQRLVRRICPDCKVLEEIDPHVRELMGISETEQFFHGAGCANCSGTGVRGRRMTYEYLAATPSLRKLIVTGVDESVLQGQALRDGMLTLTQHALGMARAQEISLQEAYLTRLE